MWKIIVAFLLFAAVALWLMSKGGDIDISGEKHGADATAAHEAPAAASTPAALPAAAASAASN